MASYKLDGAKFKELQELKDALWPFYQSKMSREDFDKYVDENVEKGE